MNRPYQTTNELTTQDTSSLNLLTARHHGKVDNRNHGRRPPEITQTTTITRPPTNAHTGGNDKHKSHRNSQRPGAPTTRCTPRSRTRPRSRASGRQWCRGGRGGGRGGRGGGGRHRNIGRTSRRAGRHGTRPGRHRHLISRQHLISCRHRTRRSRRHYLISRNLRRLIGNTASRGGAQRIDHSGVFNVAPIFIATGRSRPGAIIWTASRRFRTGHSRLGAVTWTASRRFRAGRSRFRTAGRWFRAGRSGIRGSIRSGR